MSESPSASLRTHHVALVRAGLVLTTDEGTLPRFVHDFDDDDAPDPTSYASTLVGGGVHLAPVILLRLGEDDRTPDRLHVLAGRGDEPAGGTWIPVGELADPWRTRIGTALEQHHGSPVPRRPAWFRRGWHDRVEAWVDDTLRAAGTRRTGPLRTHRVWSISAVFEVPTDGGPLWFKACCDHFIEEAAIMHRLSERIPHLVPTLVGADDEAGCSPERGMEATLAAWRDVLATSPEMAMLTDQERGELPAAADRAEALVREFWACGIPDTLSHGDLHPGNVAYDGAELRIFDWTDACVSHPFLDGSHLARVLDWYGTGEGEADRVMQAYAAPWRDAFPDADVDRALELAPLADLVFQTVTFARIAAATEDGSDDFLGTVAHLTKALLDEVR